MSETFEKMKKENIEHARLNWLRAIDNAKYALVKVKIRRTDDRFIKDVQMNDTDMLLYSIANSLLAIAQGMK